MHTLEGKHLSKTIKKTTIVHDVSVKVSSKEIV
ncbi:MAG TPA: ABC transporter ATP-binding protein, partial [Campylobacterales bacterium]|nr:ABC transporter ATP-binding protein [Campylobacterales bacterium]